MKRVDKRGFTLVELLVTMVILGMIMVIAVPNVMGIINNNKAKVYVEDANKLLSLAEYKFRGGTTIKRPSKGNKCVIMTLQYLDNSELENAPNNGEYDINNSYVVITNESNAGDSKNNYVYYVTLDEKLEKDAGHRGIILSNSEKLNNEKPTKLIINKPVNLQPVNDVRTVCSGGIEMTYFDTSKPPIEGAYTPTE